MLNQLIMVIDQNKNKRSSAKKRKALIVQKKSGTDGGPVSHEPERICSSSAGESPQWWQELHKDPSCFPQQPVEGASGRWYGFSQARLSRVLASPSSLLTPGPPVVLPGAEEAEWVRWRKGRNKRGYWEKFKCADLIWEYQYKLGRSNILALNYALLT